ncbi:hypothetical protein A3H80_02705 [Candidatus Roizmanbacteria bacterium RIFCSPLOWO2_02_FULL_37_19]|uniref:Endolytic murein transglycosylase n=1 Tax=Candidatus Roizmanbacteria bacterium RIFCSPHIGHO2_02_FULL_37_24 TaxID=1802037 RepID=A0A1F7GYY1_9BACT|nr:MAG: hypothetical protein A2862_00870 [Candidatus Roizmanbacteria bacterium RIFCSPHIGHO2_01_FULL_38_41]OGK24327.1 MAG: hypothetical protein A3C24_02190 [Candidatus Roizmanbacteria bacterium RIFCSPHIGHO2_02_FULL_37_24]OGK32085.1 MAG: hypothetical protein A3E10_00390 [Candidatus Roizmanbacteria bacterium RIFCSPHIGHO2_12_FULL_37_23]OGK44930.1 MAG: hypothetical protein A2956_04980 [Candidatus Roizmanbacteria bacterium RIFCSPLOWO2_01_FULL_37_57]OGK53771.1 MAG: hypothetical protein A3H80_02705 [Ca
MKKFAIAVTLLLILAIGFGLFYFEGSLPVNKNSVEAQIFVIEPGESVNQIINNLSSKNLIRNKLVFFMVVKQLGIENSIQAGDFRLSPSMSAKEIAQELTTGTLDKWITIIEGLRKEEIAQILSKDFEIPESEFIAQAQEGMLFPDTYLIPRSASLNDIIQIFSKNFNKKYNEELRNAARAQGLTDNEVLTLASLVEREGNSQESMKNVASILMKRWKNGWPLQVDATIQYALGYQEEGKNWWKKNLTINDLKIKSLYNTYELPGLPPGPICNPGLSAIQAVIEADENTPYWYYISNKDGSRMYYAKTLEEHTSNIRKYLK